MNYKGHKNKKSYLIYHKKYGKLYYIKNKKRIQKNLKMYYKKNKIKVNKRNKNYYNKTKKVRIKKIFEYNLKRFYNLSLKEYNLILKNSKEKCEICGNKETRKTKTGKISRIHLDHNHKTGKVRGVLCSNCNIGIGNLKHDIKILRKAIQYLKRTR